MTDKIPGFGVIARLQRWAKQDVDVVPAMGPLGSLAPRPVAGGDPVIPDYMQASGVGMNGQMSQFAGEPQDRESLYRLYDQMDMTDIASSVLDMYAEDATPAHPDTGRTVWIKCKDKAMQDAGMAMFKRIKLEEEITGLVRDMAKYGDEFDRLVYSSGPEGGVHRLVHVPAAAMKRQEDKAGKLEGYRQTGKKFRQGDNEVSYAWDYLHLRLRGTNRSYGYGTSILKNAIRPWRQMMVLEDWMVHYQVSRHPDRTAFIIDSGTQNEQEAADTARRFKQRLKRHMIVDPAGTSGKNMGYDFTPITPMEDMVLSVRQGSNTRVEKMAGSGNAVDIAPLAHTMRKFFAAVRTPQAFMGFDNQPGAEPINMKAGLSSQDIRYAKGVKRLQRAFKTGATWLCEFNFQLLSGNNPEDSTYDWTQKGKEFSVHMTPVSYLEELERLELLQIRQQVGVQLLDMARDHGAFKAAEWTAYVLREIIRIPGTELDRILRTAAEVSAVYSKLGTGKGQNVITSLQYMPPQPEDPNMPQGVPLGEHTDEDKAIIDAALKAADNPPQGELARGDHQLLSEALRNDPKLRRLIELGSILWREDGDELADSHGLVLPDRKSAAAAGLQDCMTQEDIDEVAHEVIVETERAGG